MHTHVLFCCLVLILVLQVQRLQVLGQVRLVRARHMQNDKLVAPALVVHVTGTLEGLITEDRATVNGRKDVAVAC